MNFNTPILEEDLTGSNPDNKTIDEPYELANKEVRSIATRKGPFFSNGLIVRDGAYTLNRGHDFQLVELHQEATLKTGREIYSVILILNRDISSEVTVTYQAIGGHYGNNEYAIANMYQSLLKDNRPVSWRNILDKDTEFNPTIHRHLLDDIYGFEPVVDYLERIKRAITLGQTSILLEVSRSLTSKPTYEELKYLRPSSKPIQFDALLYLLSKRKLLSDIWIDVVGTKWIKGQVGRFQVDTSSHPVGEEFYWEFYKEDNAPVTLFGTKGGLVISNGGIVDFSVYIPSNIESFETGLYLGVKKNKEDKEYLAVSYVIEIEQPRLAYSSLGYALLNQDDSSDIEKNVSYYDSDNQLRLWYQLNHY